MRRAQKGIRLSYIVACSTTIVYHLTLRSYSHSTPRPPPVSSSPASPITVSHSRFGSLQLYVDDRSPRRLAIAYRALQLVPMSFTSYAAQTETAPHLQFPLFHPSRAIRFGALGHCMSSLYSTFIWPPLAPRKQFFTFGFHT